MNFCPPSAAMNRREHLIAETLGDDDGALFARHAAAQARRRRTAKRVASGAAAMAAGVALLLALRPPPAASQVTTENPAPVSVLEIMSDEDLLTALKDQPVLLVKDETGITG